MKGPGPVSEATVPVQYSTELFVQLLLALSALGKIRILFLTSNVDLHFAVVVVSELNLRKVLFKVGDQAPPIIIIRRLRILWVSDLPWRPSICLRCTGPACAYSLTGSSRLAPSMMPRFAVFRPRQTIPLSLLSASRPEC